MKMFVFLVLSSLLSLVCSQTYVKKMGSSQISAILDTHNSYKNEAASGAQTSSGDFYYLMIGDMLGTKCEFNYEGELNFKAGAAVDAIYCNGDYLGNWNGGNPFSIKVSNIRGVLCWLSNKYVGGLMFMGDWDWIQPTIGGQGYFDHWAAHSPQMYFNRDKKLVKVEAWSQNNVMLSGMRFTFQ